MKLIRLTPSPMFRMNCASAFKLDVYNRWRVATREIRTRRLHHRLRKTCLCDDSWFVRGVLKAQGEWACAGEDSVVEERSGGRVKDRDD